MKFFLFQALFFIYSISYAKNHISISKFGVDGIDYKYESDLEKYNRWAKISDAFKYCLENNLNLYFPKGVYDVGERNFPFRNPDLKTVHLLDMKNIEIFGDGVATILKTTSKNGADVIQFNMIKNIVLRDFSITAELSNNANNGANGISITNGYENIILKNINIYDLPGVDYGTYIDGSKGVTVQFGDYQYGYKGKLIIDNVKVKNCAYGFRMDGTYLDNFIDFHETIDIKIDMDVKNAYQGVSIEFGESQKKIKKNKNLNIEIIAKLEDCQQFIRFSRLLGGNYKFIVNRTPKKLQVWNKADRRRVVFIANYIKNSNIYIKGIAGVVDEKFLIGAVGSIIEPNDLGNKTENSFFTFDVIGESLKQDFEMIEYLGESIHNSEINISQRSLKIGSNLDKLMINGNKIVIKNENISN